MQALPAKAKDKKKIAQEDILEVKESKWRKSCKSMSFKHT